jgi:hypothetical protein
VQKTDSALHFAVESQDLEAALAIVREKTGGRCVIGTKQQGHLILVQVHGFSLSPGLRGELRRDLEERFEIHQFAEGSAAAELEF